MKYKLCVLITLSILLLFCMQLFSQAHDPLRGLYIEKLLMLQPQSAGSGYPRIDLTQTFLGNAAKEDSLLNYCMENHITYLTLDAYKIMRYDPSVDGNQANFPLAQWLCDFMNKARNQFCISQIAATGSSSNYFNNIIQYDTTAHFLTPVMILDSAMKAIILPDTSLNIVERPVSSNDSKAALVEYLKTVLRLLQFDARVAIFSDNGASVSIDSAYFNRNNKAIVFKNYSGTLNANIKRSTFTCEDSSQIATTLKDGNYAFCGIQLDSIGKIIIGDTTNAHRNFFRHLYYGIKGNASSMNVRYCNFNNMRRYSPTYISSGRQLWYTWMFDVYGIYSHNPGIHAILTDTLKYCNFTDCGQGITLLNSTNSYIVSNNFDSIRQNAIFIRYPSASQVEIKDNNITHFYNGISISDARVATSVLIKSNTFDTPADLNSSPNDYKAVNWGIKLSNKLPMFTNAVISDNKMLNQRKGVYCINAAGASINNNYISLIGTSYSGKQYGIWVINSDSAHIEQDSIITVSGDTSTTHVRGIRFEASKNCRIRENYILNTGTGVNGLNYCDYTSLICNRIVNSMRGMMYENITLPQQGNVNYPQDNKWHNIALANRCLGTGNPIQWFHRYLQNDPANKFSPGINFIVASVPNQTGISPCGDPNDTLPLFISDVANQVIEDSIVFPIYDDENKRFAKEYAFRLLTKDSTLMYRGLPTDSQYQAFFAEMKARNVGKYIHIRELIGNENYAQALSELFAIQDSNLIDQNYGIALMYLASLLEDENYELTSDDSSIMNDITIQLAIEGGEAVYILRAIMDEEFDDNITGGLFRKASVTSTNKLLESTVYPNPNSGTFTYEYKLSDSCCYELIITDVRGRQINILRLISEQNKVAINTLSDNGIYFLIVRRENEIIDWKKIIVVN